MRILVVEDDRTVRATLKEAFSQAGHEADLVETGEEGEALARDHTYDLFILDIALPGLRGTELAENLRKAGDPTPILFLTALGAEEDVVKGLNLGADGYITKPFSVLELLARIRALDRRRTLDRGGGLSFGSLELDPYRQTLRRKNRSERLTGVEVRLVHTLMKAKGCPLGKDELLKKVWGIDFDPETVVLEVHLSNLRKKLRRLGASGVEYVGGRGYRIRSLPNDS
jgi:two-component system OmpR family response regulator